MEFSSCCSETETDVFSLILPPSLLQDGSALGSLRTCTGILGGLGLM